MPADLSAMPPARKRSKSFILFAVLCVLIALVSQRFFFLGEHPATQNMQHHIDARNLSFLTHVGMASLALVLLPVQFSTRLRSRFLTAHRWSGRLYALAVLLGGLSGFHMALTTPAGPVAALGFGLLAVAWLAVTGRAVLLAMRREIAHHRVWMLRSAALTFAAVTLRLQLPFLEIGLGFDLGYVIVAWSCWVPNVLVMEWVLRKQPVDAAM